MKKRILGFGIGVLFLLGIAVRANACNPPTNVTVSVIDAFNATLSWTPGDSTTSQYRVDWYTPYSTHANRITTSYNSYHLGGLMPNTPYTVRIAAICLEGPNTDSSSWVTVEFHTPAIPCVPPTGVQILYHSGNSIALGWTMGWYLQYRLSYRIIWNAVGSTITDTANIVYNNRHLITGLQPNTSYHIRLQTLNSTDPNSCSFDTTITTLACGPIDSIPYTQDFEDIPIFEGINIIPACWRTVGGTAGVSTNGGQSSVFSPNMKSLLLTGNTTLQMPAIDTSRYPMNTLQLRFEAHLMNGSTPQQVQVGAQDDGAFHLARAVTVTDNTWREYTVPLTACGGMQHIALTPSESLYLDNFTIEPIPPCPRPQNLTVAQVSATAAHLVWTVPDTTSVNGYTVTLTSDSSIVPRIVNSTEPSALVTGLQPGTRYEVRVVTNCADITDAPIGSAVFHTPALPCTSYSSQNDSILIADSTTPCTIHLIPNQQFITRDELGTPGIITGLDIYTLHEVNSATLPLVVRLLNDESGTFSYDYGPTVYHRSRAQLQTGWNHLQFDTPFAYTGGNLVVNIATDTSTYAGHTAPGLSADGTRMDMRVHLTPCQSSNGCLPPSIIVTGQSHGEIHIGWLPGGEDTLWDIYTRLSSDSTESLEAAAVDTNGYTFYNLPEGVVCTLYVVPYCDSTPVRSLADSVTVTSPCAPIDNLPFHEGFEDFDYFNHGEGCWSHLGYAYWTRVPENGRGAVQFYLTDSYLILPTIDEETRNLSIDFEYNPRSYSYTPCFLVTGVMTNPVDATTFVPVDTIAPHRQTHQWYPRRVSFENYTGPAGRIAIHAFSYTDAFIDNVTVYRTPSCHLPDSIRLVNVTPRTATFQWQNNPDAASHELEYGRMGFTPGSGTIVQTVDDSVTLTGLNPFSHYEFFLQTFCNDGDTSVHTFRDSFNTGCGLIDTLPYIEDFDQWPGGTSSLRNPMPPCWSASAESYVERLSNTHNCYRINEYGNLRMAAPPAIDTTRYPMNGLVVSFRARTGSGATPVVVGTCSDPTDAATFIPIDTVELTSTFSFHLVYLDNCPLGGNHVAFIGSDFRIDSLCIDVIPSCAIPTGLVADSTTATSADIDWVSHSPAMAAELEYGIAGFTPGTGARTIATTKPFTLTGLLSGDYYECYVRDICGAGDTSGWSLSPVTFATQHQPQTPQSVPFCNDFEDSLGMGQWQSLSPNRTVWRLGNYTDYQQTNHSIYLSGDNGATASVVDGCVALYRDIDFADDSVPLTLSFRTRVCSPNVVNYSGMHIFLVSPSQPILPVYSQTETPWGPLSDQNILYEPTANYSWATHSVELDTLHGLYRLVFLWVSEGNTPIPVALDDICISPSACPRPFQIECIEKTDTSVDLRWVGDTGAMYRVRYWPTDGGAAVTCTTYTNQLHIGNLTPGTSYTVKAGLRCGTRWSSYSSEVIFNTYPCMGMEVVEVQDTGNRVSSYRLPFDSRTPYSYTQQIFTAEDIGRAGNITSVELYHTGHSDRAMRGNVYLYLGHTRKNVFADAYDYEDPMAMQMAYCGAVEPSFGWFSIPLETPFEYNGSDNLVVGVLDLTGYTNQNCTYMTDATGQITALQLQLQNPIFPHSRRQIDTLSGIRTVHANRNWMKFVFCPQPGCSVPHLLEPNARPDRSILRWNSCGDNEEYSVQYRNLLGGEWSPVTRTADTSFFVPEVLPSVDYLYRVRHECDNESSAWALGHFTSSPDVCLPPEGLRTYTLTHHSATLAWESDENNIFYHIHVFNSTMDRYDSSYLNRIRIDSLERDIVYYATVRALCDGHMEPSGWSDTLRFMLPTCPDADSVMVLEQNGNTVTIDWDGDPEAQSWIIAYGMRGALLPYMDTVRAYRHPYMLEGLEPETEYEIRVLTECSDGSTAEKWSEALYVYIPILDIDHDYGFSPRLHISPNPTTGEVTVTLPDGRRDVSIRVIDMIGRTVWSGQTSTADTHLLVLDLSDLPAGTYLIHASGEDFNRVAGRVIKR